MHTIFHWLQNEVWYRGLRHILLMLWLFSSGKTQKIGCIYRIWVLKFIRASWQEWRFLSNRSSDHDVSHIKQNYPISSRCYKRPHVDIFICVAKKLNWNRGILNDHPVLFFILLRWLVGKIPDGADGHRSLCVVTNIHFKTAWLVQIGLTPLTFLCECKTAGKPDSLTEVTMEGTETEIQLTTQHCDTRVAQHLDTYVEHSVTIVTRQLHTPAWHSYSKPPHTYTYNIHTRTLFTDCATQTPTHLHDYTHDTTSRSPETRPLKVTD